MIQLIENKMFVKLETEFYTFGFNQMSNNKKMHKLNKPDDNVYFEVKSVEQTTELYTKFICKFDLRNFNWVNGKIVNENFNFIVNVSYKDRVWNNQGWRLAKEIIL